MSKRNKPAQIPVDLYGQEHLSPTDLAGHKPVSNCLIGIKKCVQLDYYWDKKMCPTRLLLGQENVSN